MPSGVARILTINSGSSSIRFALFDADAGLRPVHSGRIERIGLPSTLLRISGTDSQHSELRALPTADHAGAAAVLATLAALAALDPPQELPLVRLIAERFPGVAQLACFDMAFHRQLPAVARLLPIPRRYAAAGVRRYGFHGHSYDYLLGELKRLLARTEGMSADEFVAMTGRQSGLLGLSETSSARRDLLAREATEQRVREVVDLYCYPIKKQIGAYAAALGGVDTLVFTGGIGENSPPVRARARGSARNAACRRSCAAHMNAMRALLLGLALAVSAQAEESASAPAPAPTPQPGPERVSPSDTPIAALGSDTQQPAHTFGERLDFGHDWLYRRLERILQKVDTRYADPKRTVLVVPVSPMRIDLDTEVLNRQHGLSLSPRLNFDATVRLPNIERRLRLFITSSNLSEAPRNAATEREPVRAGLRFAQPSQLDFDVGVRLKLKPSAFAAVRWAPQFNMGSARFYSLVKPYVESGVGLGVSGGFALEHWHGGWVARSSSYGNWLRDSAATSWAQTLLFGHARAVIQERQYGHFTDGRDLACGTVVRATAAGERLSGASLYEFSVLYKRPLHSGWLFGYVEPLVRWERGSDWHPDAGVRIGLDALFWGLSADTAKAAPGCNAAQAGFSSVKRSLSSS